MRKTYTRRIEPRFLIQQGRRLASLRVDAGLSQAQLGYLTDFATQRISDIERGVRDMTLQEAFIFADALIVPLESFRVVPKNNK